MVILTVVARSGCATRAFGRSHLRDRRQCRGGARRRHPGRARDRAGLRDPRRSSPASPRMLFATQLQVIQSTVPPNLELTVITASVIGGVAILGGTGTVIGSTLAAILFAAIGSALIFLNVSAYWLRAVHRPPDPRHRAGRHGAAPRGSRERARADRAAQARSPPRDDPRRPARAGALRAGPAVRPVLHRRQPAQPGPADDRGRAGRARHDLRHRHRRHRPLGRLDPRPDARSCSACSGRTSACRCRSRSSLALVVGTLRRLRQRPDHHPLPRAAADRDARRRWRSIAASPRASARRARCAAIPNGSSSSARARCSACRPSSGSSVVCAIVAAVVLGYTTFGRTHLRHRHERDRGALLRPRRRPHQAR